MSLPDDQEAEIHGHPERIDSLLPDEMALRAEAIGEKNAQLDLLRLFALAVLAGAFISFGAMFATVAAAGAEGILPYGVTRVLVGVVFSLGLVLVIVGGAELFTGNALIVMGWAARRVSTVSVLRNWGIVYVGNMVGAICTAGLIFLSGQHEFGDGSVGRVALATADAKGGLGFGQALALGILCNVLVCLAVWLSLSARTTFGKIMAIVPPTAAFVAGGFEHSVANMYFMPLALFIKAGGSEGFWQLSGAVPADYPMLDWGRFVLNLVPVTIGNIIGGGGLVGAVYWFVYLRARKLD